MWTPSSDTREDVSLCNLWLCKQHPPQEGVHSICMALLFMLLVVPTEPATAWHCSCERISTGLERHRAPYHTPDTQGHTGFLCPSGGSGQVLCKEISCPSQDFIYKNVSSTSKAKAKPWISIKWQQGGTKEQGCTGHYMQDGLRITSLSCLETAQQRSSNKVKCAWEQLIWNEQDGWEDWPVILEIKLWLKTLHC